MSTTHTRDFLSKMIPWSNDNEYCNIHWATTKLRQDGKPYFSGQAAKTLDEAIRIIDYAQSRPDIKDIYVCMSKQSECKPITTAGGFSFLGAVRSQDNVTALKSLFADIDVKEGAYATTTEAVKALGGFLASHKMPMPTAVVSTGSGGVHVHWALDRELSRLEWQPLANALARALKDAGVHCDTQCTIDSARILRPPGTHNYKSGEAKDVNLMAFGDEITVEVIQAALEPFMGVQAGVHAPANDFNLPPRHGVNVDNGDLGGGATGSKYEIDINEVANRCGFVKTAIATGGATYANPLWFLTTSIATFTKGGRADAHLMAKGHPGYTVESTDAMFDRIEADRLKRDIGWPKCDKIELSGCTSCATCPLKGLGKSPLNPIEAPSADTMPTGYIRDAAGLIYRRHVDDTGAVSNVLVCTYPMTNAWLQDNPWVLHFTTIAAAGRTAKVEAPLVELSGKEGVGKVFGRQGLMVRDSSFKPLKEFLVSWIQKLQQTKDAVVSSSPFGWTMVNGKLEGFTYAGRVWAVGFDRPAAMPDPVLAYQYTPKGDIGPWMEMSKVICDQQRPALNAILAAAFGGPLVRFTGESGIMLNAYSSDSGIGKTTTMRVAQAVWADPIKSMQMLDDTTLSVANRIGQLKALPLFWDELKTEQQTAKFVTLAFQITGGKEKSRLNSDVTQRDVGTWQTLIVSASNESILDAVTRQNTSTMAGIYRCFEYVVPPGTVGQIEQSYVSRTLSRIHDNYGHAGLMYAKFLGTNHARIAQEVADLHDALRTEFVTNSEERFWLATITVLLCGARYANELGLTAIDIPALKDHLHDVLDHMRGEIKDAPVDMKNTMSVSTILAQFINAMRARHMVTTNKINIGAGKPVPGSIQIVSDTSRLDGIYVQIGRDDAMMRVSSTFFSRWMSEHDYSRHAFTKALKEEFGMRIVNGKLCSGTDKVGAMEYLMELDMNDPRLKGFIE